LLQYIVHKCAVGVAALARIIRLGLLYRIDSWYEFRANPPSSSATLCRGEEGNGIARLIDLLEILRYRYTTIVQRSAHRRKAFFARTAVREEEGGLARLTIKLSIPKIQPRRMMA